NLLPERVDSCRPCPRSATALSKTDVPASPHRLGDRRRMAAYRTARRNDDVDSGLPRTERHVGGSSGGRVTARVTAVDPVVDPLFIEVDGVVPLDEEALRSPRGHNPSADTRPGKRPYRALITA